MAGGGAVLFSVSYDILARTSVPHPKKQLVAVGTQVFAHSANNGSIYTYMCALMRNRIYYSRIRKYAGKGNWGIVRKRES